MFYFRKELKTRKSWNFWIQYLFGERDPNIHVRRVVVNVKVNRTDLETLNGRIGNVRTANVISRIPVNRIGMFFRVDMLIIQKIKIMANKTLYQVEHTICPGSTYCDAGIKEIKERMMIRLIRDIPFEDLEKLFQITTEKCPDGQNINIKIKI